MTLLTPIGRSVIELQGTGDKPLDCILGSTTELKIYPLFFLYVTKGAFPVYCTKNVSTRVIIEQC